MRVIAFRPSTMPGCRDGFVHGTCSGCGSIVDVARCCEISVGQVDGLCLDLTRLSRVDVVLGAFDEKIMVVPFVVCCC